MDNTLEQFQERYREHTHDGFNTPRVTQTSFVTAQVITGSTAGNYGIFFVATRPCVVKAISEVHTTAGSSTPTLQIERLTGTTALDSGTALLSTAFNLAGTANTVQRGVLINQTGLNQGDRLALKDIGTLTAIVGVCVTVELEF